MRSLTRIFFAFVLGSALLTSCGEDPVELSVNLNPGDVFDTKVVIKQEIATSTMGMNITVHQTMEIYQTLTVKNVNEGENTIESLTSRFVMKQSMPPINIEYDTDNPEKGKGMEEAMEPYFSKMKGLSYELVMDNKGKMIRNNAEEVYKNLGLDSLSEQGGGNKKDGNTEQYMNQLPDKPIKKGDTYQVEVRSTGAGFGLKNNYTVKKITADRVIMDVKADFFPAESNNPMMQMEVTGKQTGTVEIDRKTGMTLNSEISQNLDMVINSMGMKMPTKTKGTTTFTCTKR